MICSETNLTSKETALPIGSCALALSHASAHAVPPSDFARAKLLLCYVTVPINIHCLELFFGITPEMRNRHEFLKENVMEASKTRYREDKI